MIMRVVYINKKKMILIAVCVVLGLIIAYQETAYIHSKQVEYVPVVVAKEDIPLNTVLTKGQLGYADYPIGIINAEFMQNLEQCIGRYVIRNIKAGTPLFLSDALDNKAVVVPEGMVRVAFATNLQDALAGAVLPGSNVNVGFVSKDGKEAKLLFKNVPLVRVTDKSGNDINNENAKKANAYGKQDIIPATVTVILKPEESLLLKQCELQGRLYLEGY